MNAALQNHNQENDNLRFVLFTTRKNLRKNKNFINTKIKTNKFLKKYFSIDYFKVHTRNSSSTILKAEINQFDDLKLDKKKPEQNCGYLYFQKEELQDVCYYGSYGVFCFIFESRIMNMSSNNKMREFTKDDVEKLNDIFKFI